MDIPVAKFYFFLKQKFDPINVNYTSIAHFFPERNVTDNDINKWCFIFNESKNYIILSGDDKVNIAVLSIEDAPIKLDFDLFCNNINLDLEKFSLAEYNYLGFDIYLNYSFQLRTLITEYKAIVEKKLPPYPSQRSISQKGSKKCITRDQI